MKHLIALTIAAIFISFGLGCKKKKHDDPEPEPTVTPAITYPSYSQLKVGNYWVYEHFQTSQGDTIVTFLDSTFVSKDTAIHGSSFHKYHSLKYGRYDFNISYFRDSLDYLINSQGTILFSSEDFTTTFDIRYNILNDPSASIIDTLWKSEFRMSGRDSSVKVPAGIFITSDARTRYTYLSKTFIPPKNPLYSHAIYSKNVGLIFESTPFSSGDLIGKRLLRYHLN